MRLINNLLKGLIGHLSMFVILMLMICLCWKNSILLSILLFGSLLCLWHLKIYRTEDIKISILISFLLFIGELIIVGFGAWSYSGTTKVPIWIFFAWCHTVLIIWRSANALGVWFLFREMKKENNDKGSDN